MLTPFIYLALAPGPGPAIFDQSIAAFRARGSFSASVALSALQNKVTVTSRYKVSFQKPDRVLLTKISGGQASLIFWLNGTRFVAYDPAANEMVVRKVGAKGPISARLAEAVGNLDDPVSAQLSPDAMANFIKPFRTVPGWTQTVGNGIVHLHRSAVVNGKKAETDFQFSASSKLLTRALLATPEASLLWEFKYGPAPTNLSFSAPRGTRTVVSLTEHAHVNAADAKAANLVQQTLRSYSRMSDVAFSVNGSTGSSTDWVSGGSFREKRTEVEWSYHGGVLTLVDAVHRKSYRGRCKPGAVTSYLKALRFPVEPVLQAMLSQRNPIVTWFPPKTKVSSRGTVSLGGVTADAVELRSPLLDVSLLIRRNDHLVASVSSRALMGGKVISQSHRDFTYTSVGKPLPASAFALAVNRPLPLPKLAKGSG
jgi:hypothetical protein